MEKDDLKIFIDQNRNEFDSEKAPDRVWEKLASQLHYDDPTVNPKNRFPVLYFVSGVAATLLVLITALVGYQIGIRNNSYPENNQAYQSYTLKEKDYLQEINHKMDLLEMNSLDPSIQNDLLELDAVYQELKAELLENQYGNTAQVIDALIKNYNTKIEILEIILKKQLEGKKEEDEGLQI